MSAATSHPRVFSDRPVVVAGATGKQGGAVARHLMAHGHKIRALARNPDKPAAKALSDAGAEIAACDLEDRASIDRALDGAAAVYSVQDFLEAGVDAEIRQGTNLTEAAKAQASIEHIVYTGASTMDRNTGVAHLDSKWEIEMRLRGSGKMWTVFRPAAFLDNWEWERESIAENGVIHYPMRPEMIYRQVACDDIGAMVAQAFEHPDLWANKAAPLAGEAITMTEIAATFGRVLGRTVRYEPISYEQVEEQQGEELMTMYRSFDLIGMDGDPSFLKQWLGSATDLEAYLRKAGWGAA